MLYNFPTRRPKERPTHLPLKFQFSPNGPLEEVMVPRSEYPFLVTLPLYPMPLLLDPDAEGHGEGAATSKLWIRGTKFANGLDAQLQKLCSIVKARAVMPTGKVSADDVCRTLAKTAHAYCCAELGVNSFTPFLLDIINGDLTDRSKLIGGGIGDEPPGDQLHEIDIVRSHEWSEDLLVVRIRLLSSLGAPTHHVVVGQLK
nr:hypothetical protein [uncultured Hyphomonas sp.]